LMTPKIKRSVTQVATDRLNDQSLLKDYYSLIVF